MAWQRLVTTLFGIGTIVVALLWLRLFPSLSNRDRMVREPPVNVPQGLKKSCTVAQATVCRCLATAGSSPAV